nr:DUF1441 family protein [Marinobacter sp. CA1]
MVKLSKVQQLRRLNKSELAELFGVSVQAVDGWCRRGCPVEERGAPGRPWVFDALRVADWRFSKADQPEGQDPDTMTPQDRKAWYESESKRRELQVQDRELIPSAEVERVVATAFSAIAQGLRGLPDNIERRTGCTPEIVEAIEHTLDAEMEALADKLVELGALETQEQETA